MKNFLFMALALAAVVLTGCKKDDPKRDEPKEVSFATGSDLNLSEINVINYSEISVAAPALNLSPAEIPEATVVVRAEDGIESLKLELTTDNQIIGAALGGFSAEGGIDLVAPTTEQMAAITMLGWPSGVGVKGKAAVAVNMTGIYALVKGIPGGVNQFDITFTATSVKEVSKTTRLKMQFVDDMVTIAGNEFDIDETIAVTPATATTTPVKVDITAEGGIENLLVEIICDSNAFNTILGFTMQGLVGEFDIANPSTRTEQNLRTVGLPYGEDVKGKNPFQFDITSFVPMLAGFLAQESDGAFTADFKITVKNATGHSATKTVKMSFSAE